MSPRAPIGAVRRPLMAAIANALHLSIEQIARAAVAGARGVLPPDTVREAPMRAGRPPRGGAHRRPVRCGGRAVTSDATRCRVPTVMVVRAARPPPGLISHTPAHAGRTTETTRPMADCPAHESEVPGSPTDVVTWLPGAPRPRRHRSLCRASERTGAHLSRPLGRNQRLRGGRHQPARPGIYRDEGKNASHTGRVPAGPPRAPSPVRDANHDLSWTVHPFLFETDVPDHVRTDWEAAEARWVDPAELLTLPTVPALAAAYALVDGR